MADGETAMWGDVCRLIIINNNIMYTYNRHVFYSMFSSYEYTHQPAVLVLSIRNLTWSKNKTSINADA